MKNQPANRFLVVSHPRSGTTQFMEALNAHPQVSAHWEVFHPDKLSQLFHGANTQEMVSLADVAPADYAMSVFECAKLGSQAVGYKMFHGHNNTVLEFLLCRPDVCKIIINRENQLASYASLLLAQRDDYWHRTDDTPTQTGLVEFDPYFFYRFCAARYAALDWARRLMSETGQRWEEVRYLPDEPLRDLPRVLEFIGVDVALPQPTRIRRMDFRRPIERFSNPELVRRALDEMYRPEWAEREGATPEVSNTTEGRRDVAGLGASRAEPTQRNMLINGGFAIWQRGEVFENPSPYDFTADGWQAAFGGGGPRPARLMRVGHGTSSTHEAPSAIRIEAKGPTRAGAWFGIAQTIEGVSLPDDGMLTFSLKVRASRTMPLGLNVRTMSATGAARDNWSAAGDLGEKWSRCSASIRIDTPSDNGDCTIELFVSLPVADGDWVELTEIQLERATTPSPWEQRPVGLEYHLARRRFRRSMVRLNIEKLSAEMRALPRVSGGGPWDYSAEPV